MRDFKQIFAHSQAVNSLGSLVSRKHWRLWLLVETNIQPLALARKE